ncbi:MAG: threonine synthase [candidate division WS1 bacterium]|jgi:threonine synthase|nr:threonine synthase [candidate division WS1 bacterium]
MAQSWPGVIEHYAEWLPVTDTTPRITLLEGNTPLVHSEKLAQRLGSGVTLYFKYEGLNPTCSFKDRGMTMALSKAAEEGARITICASTGNTSAAAAAYSTRAGIASVVLLPDGYVALGKLAQALAYGARTLAIAGDFDDCLTLVKGISERYPVALVNSLNPFRLQGQKTAAFEICDWLGAPPDYHALPVGNAGNITSYWMGYTEYHDAGVTSSRPAMLGFQAAGSCPIVSGRVVEKPETVATAIRIGNPARWQEASAALRESGGRIEAVTDDEILEAYRELSGEEGIFCEPASAASWAGLRKLGAEGFFEGKQCTIAATLTGHGLKDPDRAVAMASEPQKAPNDLDAVVEILGLE